MSRSAVLRFYIETNQAFRLGLNLLLIVIPVAWASHWLVDVWGHGITFLREQVRPHPLHCTETCSCAMHGLRAVCFISIIPLQNIFDLCGDYVARRKDRDLGDFLAITLKKCVPCCYPSFFLAADLTTHSLVEATLAAILLKNCQYVAFRYRCPQSSTTTRFRSLRLLQSTIAGESLIRQPVHVSRFTRGSVC